MDTALHPIWWWRNTVAEILSLPFMRNALIAGLAVSVAAAFIGSFVVARRMAFIGAGIAHSSFAGVVIGLLIGMDPLISAGIFASLTGLSIGFLSRNYRIEEESAVGVFFPFSMALGIILLGFIKGFTPDIMGYLFGDVLLVGKTEILLSILTLVLVTFFFMIFFREMVYSTFDEETSRVLGIKVSLVYYLFLFLSSITIVVSIKVVGIILLSGLLVIPPLSALQFARNMKSYVFLSVFFGILSSAGGLFLSYWLDLPSGATIISVSFFLLLAAGFIRRIFMR